MTLSFCLLFYFDDKHWSQALFHEDLKLQCQWKVPLTKGGTSLQKYTNRNTKDKKFLMSKP